MKFKFKRKGLPNSKVFKLNYFFNNLIHKHSSLITVVRSQSHVILMYYGENNYIQQATKLLHNIGEFIINL